MWDATRQQRLDELREAETQRTLTKRERAELRALVQERCTFEAANIEAATRRSQERSAALAEQTDEVEAQNRELQALIREQEEYLQEVQAVVAHMEERRRSWRERYAQLTGAALDDPVAIESRG
jgi:hypothetical protein